MTAREKDKKRGRQALPAPPTEWRLVDGEAIEWRLPGRPETAIEWRPTGWRLLPRRPR